MMDWNRHKSYWPNARFSSFIRSGPHKWHVQQTGEGPTVLMLHGAGASTHSWAPVFSDLATSFHTIALDLPGQGFTRLGNKGRCGLHSMTDDIAALLTKIEAKPDIIIGHSAGAAIGLSLAHRHVTAKHVISVNGALENFSGVAGIFFPVFAKFLALNPLTGHLFSILSGNEMRVRQLIRSTGSKISDEQISYYRTLVRDADHVNATLTMMAQWDLQNIETSLRAIRSEVHFLNGGNDHAVPNSSSMKASQIVHSGNSEIIPDLGHLMQEENPRLVANWIRSVI